MRGVTSSRRCLLWHAREDPEAEALETVLCSGGVSDVHILDGVYLRTRPGMRIMAMHGRGRGMMRLACSATCVNDRNGPNVSKAALTECASMVTSSAAIDSSPSVSSTNAEMPMNYEIIDVSSRVTNRLLFHIIPVRARWLQ